MTAADPGDLSALLRSWVRDVPDYPQPGVMFRDITPLLADHGAFAAAVRALAGDAGRYDQVAGIEARGFILGAAVAFCSGAGFVPVRKEGKLPGDTEAAAYSLEYGEATLEVQAGAFSPGDRVLVVDDVLATGGTAAAAVELVERCGARVVEVAVLIELAALDGAARLAAAGVRAPVTSLVTY